MAATNVQAFSGDVEIASNVTAASSKFSLDTNGTLKQFSANSNNNYIKLMKYFQGASNWKIATGSYLGTSYQWLSIRAKMTRLNQDVETIQFNYFGSSGNSRVRDSIVIGGGASATQPNEIKVYNNTSNSTYEIYLQIDSATSVEVEITHRDSTIDDDYSTVASGAIIETGLTKIYDSGTTTDLRLKEGSVGIGTTNPDEALHVAGNIRLGAAEGVDDDNFKSIVTTSPLEVHSNAEDLDGLGVSLNLRSGFSDSESNIQMLSSKSNSTFQYISFATATQERMRITSAGRVGIGKTDPGTALDVVGDITASSMFIDDFIYHTNDTHTYFGFNEGDHFQIVEAGGVRFQVDSNGRVGIGVEAPAQLLDVAGRIRADTMEMDSYIYHVGDTNTYFGFNGASQFRITEGTTVALQVNDDSTIDIQNYIRHAGNTNTYMGFNANNQIVMRTNGTDRITVKSDGDVGIGTDSPATQLEIRGQTTSSIPTIRLTNTAPGNDIQDLGGLEVYSVDGGGDFCGSMIVRRDNTGASPDGNIVFRCGQNGVSSDRMIIKENGRVGIGTATPNASLDVNGSIKSRLPWLWARNTTYYTTNIASHLLTFPSVIDRDTGAGNMHAGAYKTVAFPLTGTYVVYVAGHSVFGASHISYFRGTLYNSSNGAREAFYSQSSQSVGANHDNFAGTTFVVHANSGDYMNITHDTTVANQRNYSGSHQIIVATMISGTY